MVLHEKQINWLKQMREKTNLPRRRKQSAGCYGVCCDEYVVGSRLCTQCRRVSSSPTCCDFYTVHVNPRHEVPRKDQAARWKRFLRLFPQYKSNSRLRVRKEWKASVGGKRIFLHHRETNEFKWLNNLLEGE
jgi:hypothetical protein